MICHAADHILSQHITFDSPKNTSAPLMASSNVCTSRRSVAKNFLLSVKLGRSLVITPLLSSIKMFSFRAPNATYSFVQEVAEAPAPFTTILTFSIFFPATSNAFNKPADE